jgi:hypothetical protein
MCLFLAVLLTVPAFLYYRYTYTYRKRLRVVDPGLVYRSGSMTAPGFREAIKQLGIRTVLNLQDDVPDPNLANGYFGGGIIKERELCKELGVRYAFIGPDLVDRRKLPDARPKAIDQFLALMDDPSNYPVLIHCKAGLHRTGCLVALYRMEYDGWTMEAALRELKSHGFGEFVSTKANDYIREYVVGYRPRKREASVRGQGSGVSNQEPEQ